MEDLTLIISLTIMVVITAAWMFIAKRSKKDKQMMRRKWKSMSKSEQVKYVDTMMDKWFNEENW
tara:strand:+ start:532 stop:723 length:192 start_codon:yes stop_codon:yes gene_type:complete